MDLLDLVWNASQEMQLGDVRHQVDRLQTDRELAGLNVRDLAAENVELKLRLGLLVRLLVSKGVISAEEFAGLIAETRTTA